MYVSQARRSAPSRQMMFKGITRQRTARGDAQLTVDRTHMGVDGVRAYDELLSDLRVGQALGHQSQYLDLPGCEPIGREQGFRGV